MKKLLILLSVIALIFTLAACGGECTVTFMSDGEVYHTATVKKGEKVPLPSEPTKDGYTFMGWMLDGEKFDTAAGISKNITLEALLVDDATAKFGDDLEYALSEDGTYYAVAGIGGWKTPSVVIPASHKGLPVTAVLERAFFGKENITSISIPASVTEIGDRAFSSCTALTSFTVASDNTALSVKDGDLYSADGTVLIQYAIGKAATELTVGEGVMKIGAGALSYSSLTSVSLPSTLEELADYSCYGSVGLDSVSFADGSRLKNLGEAAFSNCTALKTVTIPKSVEKLGQFAFYTCTSLTDVRFEPGAMLCEVGEYAFEKCTSLIDFYYDGSRNKFNSLVSVADNNGALDSVKFAGPIGNYTAPDGAWIPTEEYEGITYAAWLTEADYLAGLAPTKWYTSTELLRENFGATDDNGSVYPDPDFIPGYIHIYTDVTIPRQHQLIVGHAQKLVLNLGGNTVEALSGFRVGGSYGYHPDAEFTVKCGTFNLTSGQIQPRGGSTLIFENTTLTVAAANVIYGGQSKLIHFKNSELINTTGSSFHLSTNFTGRGDGKMEIRFEDTDLLYKKAPTVSLFTIYESQIGDADWKIYFDSKSSIIGEVTKFATLTEVYVEEIHSFVKCQYIYLEEGVRLLGGASVPTEYEIALIDPETNATNPATARPINDGTVAIIKDYIAQ